MFIKLSLRVKHILHRQASRQAGRQVGRHYMSAEGLH